MTDVMRTLYFIYNKECRLYSVNKDFVKHNFISVIFKHFMSFHLSFLVLKNCTITNIVKARTAKKLNYPIDYKKQ